MYNIPGPTCIDTAAGLKHRYLHSNAPGLWPRNRFSEPASGDSPALVQDGRAGLGSILIDV